MPLAAGDRFGSFDIVSRIGAGGMGEVYRARDTRLGRDVAVKVLPSDLMADPERRARFEREARVLASLNHPNIATMHGVEEHGGVPALVMELVEGQTLAGRLSGGRALPVAEALDIAVQSATALAAAHAAQIVHRDFKPANVMLRPDGYAKVLDFGLATAPATQVDSLTATRDFGHTAPGTVMGTVPYMAPEQARGLAADARRHFQSRRRSL